MDVLIPILILVGAFLVWRFIRRAYHRRRFEQMVVEEHPGVMKLFERIMAKDWYVLPPAERAAAAVDYMRNPLRAYGEFRAGGGDLDQSVFHQLMLNIISDDPACAGLYEREDFA